MGIERKIATVKSRKAVTSLLNQLINETILLSLKEFTTEELITELANRENAKVYAHKFLDEEHGTIEILIETDDESLLTLSSRTGQGMKSTN